MFKAFVFGILTSIVVAVLCAYFIVRAGVIPANADAQPFWLESWAAGTSLDETLAREAPKGPDPMTDENLIAGITRNSGLTHLASRTGKRGGTYCTNRHVIIHEAIYKTDHDELPT